MQATDLLIEEHHGVKISLRILEQLCVKLAGGQGCQGTIYADDLGKIFEFLQIFVDKCHHAKEENALFPAMSATGGLIETELIKELLAEHVAGRKLVTEMTTALKSHQTGNRDALSALSEAAKSYSLLLTDHIAKEERELYPIADVKISTEDQQKMVEVFEKIETDRIGPKRHEKFHAMLGELKQKYLQK